MLTRPLALIDETTCDWRTVRGNASACSEQMHESDPEGLNPCPGARGTRGTPAPATRGVATRARRKVEHAYAFLSGMRPSARTTSRAASSFLGLIVIVMSNGCGGAHGGSASTSGASRSPVTHSPVLVDPGVRAASLARVSARLRAAGLNPVSTDASPPTVQSLAVDGTSVSSYRNTQDAARVAGVLTRILTAHPGQGRVQLVGAHVYQYAQTGQLTGAQRARFDRVVAVGEGRK